MENKFKYSVIVPHKNCPDLLERCVRSIPAREDIQIIVVDDNSQSLSELQGLESDIMKSGGRNIKFVYTTSGKGAGYARNEGLKLATGTWLVFSDADDFFTDKAFELFDEFANSDADIVVFKHQGVDSATLQPLERSEARNRNIDEFIKTGGNPECENRLRYNNDVPWAKMVRRGLVVSNNIQFSEVPASNDIMFSTLCGHYCKKMYVCGEIAYYATTRSGSITKTRSLERYFSFFTENVKRNEFVKKAGHPENQGLMFSRLIMCLHDFGIGAAFRCIRIAVQHKVNPFSGISQYVRIGAIRSKVKKGRKIFSDKYMINSKSE